MFSPLRNSEKSSSLIRNLGVSIREPPKNASLSTPSILNSFSIPSMVTVIVSPILELSVSKALFLR